MDKDWRKFIKEYRVELAAALLVLVGIFLLVENFSIRDVLRAWYAQSLGLVDRLANLLVAYLRNFTLSDALGWTLVFSMAAFVVWRVRYRFAHMERYKPTTCPRCGGRINRLHRSRLDHLLAATLLPHARRYGCATAECGWTGLRRPKHRHGQTSHHHQDAVSGDQPVDPGDAS